MEGGSRRAIVAACAADLGIAVAKFIGFAVTGAASMLAEAVHSVADTSNQGLLLLGGSRARRKASPDHPFGHGRERYFWAFVVAVVIFSIGSLFALAEGFQKIRNPHELESWTWAVGILLVAIVFESYSLRTAIRESRERVKRAGSWWAFIRNAKEPELPVVLLEDFGAVIGIVFALAGVGLAHLTGNPRFDAVGSVAIGLLLGAIAVILAKEMQSLLIGESASSTQLAAIRSAIREEKKVCRLIHMRTEHVGPDHLLVAAKIELEGDLRFPDVADTIDSIEARIRDVVPEARWIYLEPDVVRPARAAT
jgi:cation diffusion facilitator family transporter